MRSLRSLLFAFAVVAASAVAAPSPAQPTPPQSLLKAAEAFARSPATNRLAEGENLSRELPRCPLKYEKDVGTGIYRQYDFSRPSYLLSTQAVITLLGKPTSATTNYNSIYFQYLARKTRERPSSGDWFLQIEFQSDRAVRSYMHTKGTGS